MENATIVLDHDCYHFLHKDYEVTCIVKLHIEYMDACILTIAHISVFLFTCDFIMFID